MSPFPNTKGQKTMAESDPVVLASDQVVTITYSGGNLATESTLQQILSSVDNMRDYEVRLVQDSTLPNSVTWLEVRYWDAQSGTLGSPVYYLAGSTTPGSPVLPISYINDRTILSQILAELMGTLTVDGTVNVGNFPSNFEISNDIGNPVPINGTVSVAGTVSANQSGTWDINNISGTVSLPTGAATETTINSINTKLTPTTRTHNTISVNGIGTVPSGSLRGSVINVGSSSGIWNGINLPTGVSIPWDSVGSRDTYGAISYNATGTSFIIEYTT